MTTSKQTSPLMEAVADPSKVRHC
uniref:Uncharacterized protein n=1 Tax=Arundo donax TaxID=35708 RepID=A0A0A9A4D1_ARUDO